MKKMIKTFTIGLMLISSLIAHGETETVNGVTWNYTLESGEVTIDSVALGTNQTVTIPSTLGGAHVTSIGYEAFEGCNNLTHVTIPASVTDISPRIFEWCTSLQDFELAPGNANFKSDSGLLLSKDGKTLVMAARKLTNVTIPEGVTTIDYFAFYGCSNLEKVTIPNSVVEIGLFAFAKCRRLTQMRIPASVTNINFSVFSECSSLEGIEVDPDNVSFKSDSGLLLTRDGKILMTVPQSLSDVTIPGGVTIIGSYAFKDCNRLTNVTIPEGVKIVWGEAFRNCSNLTQITISASVTFIGERPFAGCTRLQGFKVAPGNADLKSEPGVLLTKSGRSVVAVAGGLTNLMIPDGVTYIRDRELAGNTNLTSVTIPASLTNISQQTFSGCANLKTFDVSPDNPNFRSHEGLLLSKDGKTIVAVAAGLTDVTIPENVTCIGESAFAYCRKLTHMTIPASVKCIERDAFKGCHGLTGITIPDGVTKIGDHAFKNCQGLRSMAIPASVTEIGNGVFSGCTMLKSVAVSPDSTHFKSESGLLLSKDGTTLIEVIGILTNTTLTGTNEPERADNTITIRIPDGVVNIRDEAFKDCHGLTSITIPSSVTNMKVGTFWSSSKRLVVEPGNPRYFVAYGWLLDREAGKIGRLEELE